MTFVDYTVTSTEETVESQVATARDERDRLALWGRILPITFTAVGLVALIGGALLGSFSLRAESALIDPGLDEADHGFFGSRGPEAIGCPVPRRRPRSCPRPDHRTCPRTDPSDHFVLRNQTGAIVRSAGVRAGARAPGDGAAAVAGLSAAARRGVDAAVVPLRCGARPVGGGAAGGATGLLRRADLGLIDGGIVVKALLVVGLWLAGWGAARLAAAVLPDAGIAGQFVAATLAIWNPYVAERLLQGHWSLLVGYGCLPWVATTMLRLRSSSASTGRVCSRWRSGSRWPG